jgi:hypothetical protein
MQLAAAVDVLKDLQPDRLPEAFRTALRDREQWPLPDLLSYRDIWLDGQIYLPASADWVVDVDLVTKPKQGGGVRIERLLDIFTGTLLQNVSDALASANASSQRLLRADLPFTFMRPDGLHQYEMWAKALTAWLQERLIEGRAVLIVDFADFFSSIHFDQIRQALASAGLAADIGEAVISIFNRINSACDGLSHTKGLPIVPDHIVWAIADLVLRRFDEHAMLQPSVTNYTRWVDDCFIACDAMRTSEALQRISDLAKVHGFNLNPAKTRVLSSLEDLDRAMLRREHDLLTDLLEIATGGGANDLKIERFLPQLRARLIAGRPEDTRLVKRLYTLASAVTSTEMLSTAAKDMADYPAAERQILSYLSKLYWPHHSEEILMRSLSGDGYDSRQLFTLALLLDVETRRIPAAAHHACKRIVAGEVPAHQFARPLAFAVLMNDISGVSHSLLRQFAREIPGLTSSLARRVGLELLSTAQHEHFDWSRYSTDASPLVRRLVELSASPLIPGAVAAHPGPPARLGSTWRSFEDRLLQRLNAGEI